MHQVPGRYKAWERQMPEHFTPSHPQTQSSPKNRESAESEERIAAPIVEMKLFATTSLLITLLAAVAARPEPPVNQYLPPNQQFIPAQRPSDFTGSNPPPAMLGGIQYLPPNSNAFGAHQGYDDGSTGEPAKYEFEYTVNDFESGNDFGHRENAEDGVARGIYYVLLPDGRRQTVEYEADENGFRPKVTYTDEGTRGGNAGGNGGYGY